MSNNDLTPEEKIIQARVCLISKFPFYGALTLHLTFKEDPTGKIVPTMGVTPNGSVYYNPKFVAKLSKEEMEAVLCHEVLHVALKHLDRVGNRNRFKANIAMDYAINLIVAKDFKLPKECLIDHKWENMAWEQIYDQLPEPPACTGDCSKCPVQQGKQQLSPNGDKACRRYGSFDRHFTRDDIENASGKNRPDGTPMSPEELEENGFGEDFAGDKEDEANAPNWKKIMNDALATAKQMGKLPAGLERMVDEFGEPQLSWRELLAQYLQRSIPWNFTYRRMSRKSITTGIFFPGTEKEEIKVTIVVDTSGSMGDEELREAMTEILGLTKQFERIEIELYSCDAYLSKASKVSSEYDLQTTRLQGGGGTNYAPIFHKIAQKEMDTKILVYIGDMYAQFPREDEVPCGLTTIFIVTKNGDEHQVPDYFPLVVKLK